MIAHPSWFKEETRIRDLEKALDDACDVAIWLSGLDCLRTNGEAWRTWEDSMRPKLFAALDARGGSNQDDAPAKRPT